MKLTHLAMWVDDLEGIRRFYENYFEATAGEKYVNTTKQYSSYFLSFADGNCRIEIMHRPGISEHGQERGELKGLAHIAFSVGTKQRVDELTLRLRTDGYVVQGEPRTTGDGFYESIVLDPERNWVEITE